MTIEILRPSALSAVDFRGTVIRPDRPWGREIVGREVKWARQNSNLRPLACQAYLDKRIFSVSTVIQSILQRTSFIARPLHAIAVRSGRFAQCFSAKRKIPFCAVHQLFSAAPGRRLGRCQV